MCPSSLLRYTLLLSLKVYPHSIRFTFPRGSSSRISSRFPFSSFCFRIRWTSDFPPDGAKRWSFLRLFSFFEPFFRRRHNCRAREEPPNSREGETTLAFTKRTFGSQPPPPPLTLFSLPFNFLASLPSTLSWPRSLVNTRFLAFSGSQTA